MLGTDSNCGSMIELAILMKRTRMKHIHCLYSQSIHQEYLILLARKLFFATILSLTIAHHTLAETLEIDATTLAKWSAPYRGWHYHPDHVIPAKPAIKGFEDVEMTDVPTVFQIPDDPKWYMSFIGFDGKGYQSFIAESDDLINWGNFRLAMGYGPKGSFDHGGEWEKSCIYQPWLVEHKGDFYNFYNAANGNIEQSGIAISENLTDWERQTENPVLPIGEKNSYNQKFSSDPKVYRDGDHWTCFFFGVGKQGAHIMAAFSRDLLNWTIDPEPLYKAGQNPSGLDKQYAHKTSLVWNPSNQTFYLFYNAVGTQGRGIGLISSEPLAETKK